MAASSSFRIVLRPWLRSARLLAGSPATAAPRAARAPVALVARAGVADRRAGPVWPAVAAEEEVEADLAPVDLLERPLPGRAEAGPMTGRSYATGEAGTGPSVDLPVGHEGDLHRATAVLAGERLDGRPPLLQGEPVGEHARQVHPARCGQVEVVGDGVLAHPVDLLHPEGVRSG